MYGTMNSRRTEYDVQPSYNESVLPICPPSYSEAVAPPLRDPSNTYLLPYPKQPDFQPDSAQNSAVVPASVPAPAPQQIVVNPCLPIPPAASILPIAVGPKSCILKCPHCLNIVRTKTKTSLKRSAHYSCCLLFFCGCALCSCIPYCLASFKNVHHTCPTCNGFIGTYRS